MTTTNFTETFVRANVNKTVKFNYCGEENIGEIVGYGHGNMVILTDHNCAWPATPRNLEDVTVISKEPILDIDMALSITYDMITEVIEDNPVVTEAESIAKNGLNSFTYALIMAIMLLVFLFCCSNATYSQVKVSKEKTEVLASVRLGNAKIMQHEAQYVVTMADKNNSGAKSRLQLHGYSFDSGVVVLVLGDKETAIGVLEYLANNKPAKGEEVTIAGNENTAITYSNLLGGWQFHQYGMSGNLSQGEAKKFLKVINK